VTQTISYCALVSEGHIIVDYTAIAEPTRLQRLQFQHRRLSRVQSHNWVMLPPKYYEYFVLLHICILFLNCTYTIYTHTLSLSPILVYISLTLPVNYYNSQFHTQSNLQNFVSELSYYDPFVDGCLLFAISTITSSKWRNQLMKR
jgi:hypothetical protein